MGDLKSALGGAASGASAGAATGNPYVAAAGGAVGLLAGLLGGGEDKGEEQRKAILAQLEGLQLPDIEQLKLQLEELKLQGKITPEQEAAVLQEASQMEQVSTDPRLKEAQMSALEKLRQVGEGGLTLGDRAALGEVQRDTAREAQARQESILQNMAQRGAGGSGAEAALQQMASQAAAERQSRAGLAAAADVNKRALESIMARGTLSSQLRDQEFGEKSQTAKATDLINNFNARNSQDIQMRNVASRNAAQEANLTAAQRIADQNVALRNRQQEYNKNLAVDDYQRRLDKIKAAAGQTNTNATAADLSAQRERDRTAGIISGIGTAAAGIAGKGKTQAEIDAEAKKKLV